MDGTNAIERAREAWRHAGRPGPDEGRFDDLLETVALEPHVPVLMRQSQRDGLVKIARGIDDVESLELLHCLVAQFDLAAAIHGAIR